MKISIVVAVADDNAIGAGGNLLWRLPADMQFFKQVTWGHHVLMGRKTWDSIPAKFRPLPGRANIVVTRQPDFNAEGCKVVSSVEEGIKFAQGNGEDELMVIGGGEIYRQAIPLTNKAYVTRVHHVFNNADTFLPALAAPQWKVVSTESHAADDKHKHAFDITVLDRAQ